MEMTKIRGYFKNGGLKDIIQLSIQLLVYLIILGFFAGKIYYSNNELEARVNKLEQKQECLEEIKIRLKAVEENQERILEILQGKYK